MIPTPRRTWLHLAQFGVRLLARYPFRTSLTLLVAALGVATVIASVNYAAAGRERLLSQIRRLGTNVLIVTPHQSRAVAGRARTGDVVTTLVQEDYSAIRREIPQRIRSSAVASGAFRVKAQAFSRMTQVVGCEPDYFRIKNWPLADGVLFGAGDLRRSARVAVLGTTVAMDLFGDQPAPGAHIFINRVPFQVIGVLAERGQGIDIVNEDSQVFIPLTAAMRRLLNVNHYSAVLLEIDRWDAMDHAAETVRTVLRDRHRSGPKKAEDFQVQNQKSLIDTQLATSERLGSFVRWVGWSALIVSGLGILAIAWISVRARMVEIGTRRALGATRGDVFFQMVFESGIVSLAGAVCGIALGWWISHVITSRAELPFVFDRENAVTAVILAGMLNQVFALLPALRAAHLDPIRALGHE